MTTKAEMKALRDAIAACKDRSGRIRPELVVEAARDPKSVLHRKFKWDVHKAAMAHWLATAQELIRQVKLVVVVEDVRISAPFYVSDPTVDFSAYVETTSLAGRNSVAEDVLLDETARIEGAVARARGAAAVFKLSGHFEKMLAHAVAVKRKVRRRKSSRAKT